MSWLCLEDAHITPNRVDSGHRPISFPYSPRSSSPHHTCAFSNASSLPVGSLLSRHLSGANAKPTFPQLNLHNTRVRRNPERLPSSRCVESAQHRARARISACSPSDTALRLPGTDPFGAYLDSGSSTIRLELRPSFQESRSAASGSRPDRLRGENLPR
jgi:hypothetical protein